MSLALLAGLLGRGMVVLALAFLAERVLWRSSAGVRHGVWVAALVTLLALPLVALCVPRIEVPLVFVERAPSLLAGAGVVPADASGADVAAATAPFVAARAAGNSSQPFVLLWLLGASALVGLHIARRLVLARWVLRAEPLSRSSAEPGKLRVLVSAATPVPLAVDFPRRAILLPAAARGWDPERLRAVLRHEMEHLARRDGVLQTLAEVARALHWLDPLVWLALRRLVHWRERSCDDRVLASGERASEYARHLLAVASAVPASIGAGLAPALGGEPEVAGRVRALLDTRRSHALVGPRAVLVIGTAAALVAGPLAGLRAAPRSADALELAREIFALARSAELDPADLRDLRAALADDRRVDPRALGRAPGGPRQGSLPETTVGKEAARAFVAHPGAVDELRDALGDEPWPARENAAWGLGCIGARGAARDLALILASDEHPRVRRIAAWALGEMTARSERVALEVALADPSPEVRAQAAHSLGDLEDARAWPALVTALLDPSALVRERAAHGLGDLAVPGAAPALRAALDDEDGGVRDMVRWALGQVTER